MNKQYKLERRGPFTWAIDWFDENTRIVFVGSITSSFGKDDFYYASRYNCFWYLLDFIFFCNDISINNHDSAKVLKEKIFCKGRLFRLIYELRNNNSKKQKSKLRYKLIDELKKKRIAIFDIFSECYMKDNGNRDKDIENSEPLYPSIINKALLRCIENVSRKITYCATSQYVADAIIKFGIHADCIIVLPTPSQGDRKTFWSKLGKWASLISPLKNWTTI